MPPDPFDVLGLPPRFALDPGEISRAYFARSALAHPDVAGAGADAERQMAALNRARAVLEDPEQRADALLLKLGGPGRSEHKELPPEFLMEMMEVRQEIEAALEHKDPEERQRRRAHWEAWAADQRRAAIRDIQGVFESLGDAPSPGALEAIRVRLNAWRYIERLIEQLDPAYDPARADFGGRSRTP